MSGGRSFRVRTLKDGVSASRLGLLEGQVLHHVFTFTVLAQLKDGVGGRPFRVRTLKDGVSASRSHYPTKLCGG